MHRTHKSERTTPHSARLVRLVTELGSPAGGKALPNFGERLGRLFDLSDTIVLDDASRRVPRGPFETNPAEIKQRRETLAADLGRTRDALAGGITEGFESPSVTDPLPVPKAPRKPGVPPSFDLYQRFYQARQRPLTVGAQRLRGRVRKAMSKQSPALAQLAELDAIFDTTLVQYGRHCFGALPTVLEKRFKTLWRHHHKKLADAPDPPEDWIQEGAWLDRFHQEMRLLLLAELEARLEPVQGLLDALNNEDANP